MTEFVSIDISSALAGDAARDIIARELPKFAWRRGDSDEQGKYISGSSAGVKIQCWVDEKPMAMSISFRSASLSGDERENLIETIFKQVVPQLGNAVKVERK